MPSEFSPPGGGARMTAAQVRKYIKDMKQAQAIAEEKLKQAQASGDFQKEATELKNIEDELENFL